MKLKDGYTIKQLPSADTIRRRRRISNNLREYFDDLANRLLIVSPEHWYGVRRSILHKDPNSHRILHQYFGGSLSLALWTLYPEYEWQMWRFDTVPAHYWENTDKHHVFMEWISKELGIVSPERWYKIKYAEVSKRGGKTMLKLHGDSIEHSLTDLYPEYNWQPWRFETVPRGFWDQLDNQRVYLEWFASCSNISAQDEWYQVKNSDIVALGGQTLMHKYNASLVNLLRAVYPAGNWQPWRFCQAPKNYWSEVLNQLTYMEWLSEQLNIVNVEDWKGVSSQQVNQFKGTWIAKQYPGKDLVEVLQLLYPEHTFMQDDSILEKSQNLLFRLVNKLFPEDTVIYTNSMLPLGQFANCMDVDLSLDIYVPSVSLAFEYQGQQHYQFNNLFGSPTKQQERDQLRREVCSNAHLTLIEIPYWWEFDEASIISTVHHYRPDIVGHPGNALPLIGQITLPTK